MIDVALRAKEKKAAAVAKARQSKTVEADLEEGGNALGAEPYHAPSSPFASASPSDPLEEQPLSSIPTRRLRSSASLSSRMESDSWMDAAVKFFAALTRAALIPGVAILSEHFRLLRNAAGIGAGVSPRAMTA